MIKSFGVGWSLHWGWISLTRWCRELERWAGGPARGRICQRFFNFAEWHNMTFKFMEASALGWSWCVLMIDLEVKHSKSPKHIMCSQCLDPRSSLILAHLHLGFHRISANAHDSRDPMADVSPQMMFSEWEHLQEQNSQISRKLQIVQGTTSSRDVRPDPFWSTCSFPQTNQPSASARCSHDFPAADDSSPGIWNKCNLPGKQLHSRHGIPAAATWRERVGLLFLSGLKREVVPL